MAIYIYISLHLRDVQCQQPHSSTQNTDTHTATATAGLMLGYPLTRGQQDKIQASGVTLGHSYRCHVLYIFHFNDILQQRRHIQLDVVQRCATPCGKHISYVPLAALMYVATEAGLHIAVQINYVRLP